MQVFRDVKNAGGSLEQLVGVAHAPGVQYRFMRLFTCSDTVTKVKFFSDPGSVPVITRQPIMKPVPGRNMTVASQHPRDNITHMNSL
jgi:hypothetical protein